MSRLHDIKKGLGKIASTAVEKTIIKPAFAFSGKAIQKLSKEDPEKVKIFLSELINDDTVHPEVRNACRNLLAGVNAGTPIEKVVQVETKKAIDHLEDTLIVSVKKT